MPAQDTPQQMPVVNTPAHVGEKTEAEQLHVFKVSFREKQKFKTRDDVKKLLTLHGI